MDTVTILSETETLESAVADKKSDILASRFPRLAKLISAVALATSATAVAGCEVYEPIPVGAHGLPGLPNRFELIEDVTPKDSTSCVRYLYVRDSKTDICYFSSNAGYNYATLTAIPCEKVMPKSASTLPVDVNQPQPTVATLTVNAAQPRPQSVVSTLTVNTVQPQPAALRR